MTTDFKALSFDDQAELIRKNGADTLTREELLAHVRAGIDKMNRETRGVGERLKKLEPAQTVGLGALLLQKLGGRQ